MRLHVAIPSLVLVLGGCRGPGSEFVSRADSMAVVIDSEAASLARDTAVVFGLSAEGAFLEAHYQHDALRRLRGSFPGELGRATETYYFNPTLFLVVRTDERYNAPLSGRVRDSGSDRIYIGDGVTRWLRTTDARRDLDSAAARRTADSLNASARELLARLPRRESDSARVRH